MHILLFQWGYMSRWPYRPSKMPHNFMIPWPRFLRQRHEYFRVVSTFTWPLREAQCKGVPGMASDHMLVHKENGSGNGFLMFKHPRHPNTSWGSVFLVYFWGPNIYSAGVWMSRDKLSYWAFSTTIPPNDMSLYNWIHLIAVTTNVHH